MASEFANDDSGFGVTGAATAQFGRYHHAKQAGRAHGVVVVLDESIVLIVFARRGGKLDAEFSGDRAPVGDGFLC